MVCGLKKPGNHCSWTVLSVFNLYYFLLPLLSSCLELSKSQLNSISNRLETDKKRTGNRQWSYHWAQDRWVRQQGGKAQKIPWCLGISLSGSISSWLVEDGMVPGDMEKWIMSVGLARERPDLSQYSYHSKGSKISFVWESTPCTSDRIFPKQGWLCLDFLNTRGMVSTIYFNVIW